MAENLAHNKRRKLANGTELKTKDLRLYYLVIPKHGITICIGGTKKNQKKDISILDGLSKEILEQIKKYGNLTIISEKEE